MTCFKLQGMWSQNQKTAELGRGPIWTHPILKAGLTRVGYSVLCLAGFWVSQNRRTPKYLWTAAFWIQQLKKDLKCSSVISCISFCPIAFSLTEYHWKEHSSTVFIFPLQVVAYIGKVPLILLFSSWTILALPLFLCQMLQSLCLCGPSLHSFLYICVSLVLWRPQLDTTLHAVFSPLLRKGEGSSPLDLLVMLPLMHSGMLLATSAARAQC